MKELGLALLVMTLLVIANKYISNSLSNATLIYEGRFNSVPYRSYKVYKLEDGNCVMTIGKNARPKLKEVNCPK